MIYLNGFIALIFWVFILPACYLLGSYFERCFKDEDPLFKGVFIIGMGFGVLAYLVVILGTLHFLIWQFLLFLGLLLIIPQLSKLKSFKEWLSEIGCFFQVKEKKSTLFVLNIIFLITSILTVILCFLPEIANDSLAYHLNLPKVFVWNKSIMPLQYDVKSYQSQFMECLYVIGIFFRNVTVAKLFHWMTAFLLTVFLMRWIDKRTGNRTLAFFLGLILWLTPTLWNQIPTTYNDAAVCFYVLLSFYLFQKALIETKSNVMFLMSGVFMGFAASTKYLALMVGFGMGLFLLIRLFYQREKKQILMFCFLFSLGTALTCGYWFIRNYILEGSPLYPIFTQKFGNVGLYSDWNYSAIGVKKTFLNFIFLFYYFTFRPSSFEYHFWIGPFYLCALPVVALAWFKKRNIFNDLCLFLIVLTSFLWFYLAQSIRFLFPVFPLLVILFAQGIMVSEKLVSNLFQRIGVLCFSVCLLFYAGLGFYHYRVQWIALVENWSGDVFLTKLERTYPAAQWVNKYLPKEAKIFSVSEMRLLYFERPVIDQVSYYRVSRYPTDITKEDFVKRLKDLGITHIMRTQEIRGEDSELRPKDAYLKVTGDLLKDQKCVSFIRKIESQNEREARYNYFIYKLN